MKKGFAIVLAMLLLVVMVTPAFAAGKGPGKPAVRNSTFAVVGEVTAITGENITLTILSGNRTVKDLLGEEITVVTTDETVFRHFGDDLGVYITLEDVAVGQLVSAGGLIVDSAYVAGRVVTDVPFDCPQQ